MTASYEELKQIVKSQKRQQAALIVLSVVLAASAVVTWKSRTALRETNEIQKQMLESRKAGPASKAALRRSNARPATEASAESQRPSGWTSPAAHKRTAAIDGAPDAASPGTRPLLDRPGRQ